jgi:glycosyltransferase involved in cell wall biosynthesis
MEEKKKALVAVDSNVARDPRVRRQIDWLADEGWTVDSLGAGDSPGTVRDHFQLGATPRWMLTKLGTLFIYGLLSEKRKFRALTLSRFPAEVRRRLREGDYDVIILNDRHFVPWVAFGSDFTPAARRGHIHLDLHEYFVPKIKRDSLWRMATASQYEWARHLIGSNVFSSRSTVNSGIAELYADEFQIETPAIIRNSPPYVEQSPTPVNPDRIRLIHHGMASWDRGLRQMVDALRLSDERFSLTFMLVGSPQLIDELREYARDLGDRVQVVPPAAMADLAKVVNAYDLEVMFYAPLTRNLELALPNKFFEAVQGRLGLIVGESPMMAQVVAQYGNGRVVKGWDPAHLAATLNSLSANDVEALKSASDRAAHDLNATAEREVFLEVLGVRASEATS